MPDLQELFHKHLECFSGSAQGGSRGNGQSWEKPGECRWSAHLQPRPRTQGRAGWRHSLAEEALGDGAQFSPTVLDEVHLLVHHHVVQLLPLLRDHDVGVALHAQLQAYGGDTVSTRHWEQPGQVCGSRKPVSS